MKKKKCLASLLALLMLFSLVLTGCGNSEVDESTGGETEENAGEVSTADEAKEGKSAKSDLVIAMKGDIKQIGYAQNGRMIASLVAPTLFNCVTTDDGSYEYVIENSIVESYEWSEDHTAITLTLKEGVPMHDGTTLDAEDVVYSIQHTDEFGSVAGYNIVFEDVAALESNVVYIPFQSANIGNWKDVGERMIYSKEAAEASGDFAVFSQSDAFAGYGPYQVVEWNAGDSIVLKKFDDYYGGNDSPITDVIVRRIDEDTTAFSELQTGGVNMILYPTQYDIDDVKNGVYADIKYQTAPGLYQQLFVFNLDAGSACADVRVRQAICYAIDKEAMWKGAFESSGYLANTPASMTQEFMEEMPDPYPFDLDKAKALFEEAGYGEGSTLVCCVDNDTYRTTAYEMLKNNLAKIGITLEVKTGDNATYLGYVTGGVDWDLEIGKSGMMGSMAKWLRNWWAVFHHGDTAGEDFTECQAMMDEILECFDDEERYELTQEFAKKFTEEWCLTYPIRQDEYATLLSANLTGYSLAGEQINLVGAYYAE